MMKTANQEFITFNEPIIQSYLLDVNLFVFTFPTGKAYLYQNNISKIKIEESQFKNIKSANSLTVNNNRKSVKTTD